MFDYTSLLILLPALALAAYAQWKVQSTYSRYAAVDVARRTTAEEVARRILNAEYVQDVSFESVDRKLGDHYDPRKKVLRLSAPQSSSVAAIGVAAHEAGHAIQHAKKYAPLALRSVLVPVANFGSQLAMPLFLVGLFTQLPILMTVGIVLFSAAVLFTLVTLPVEFNASRRAVRALELSGVVTTEELGAVKQVLSAAALTYVAAAAMAALQLVRLLLLANSRRR
ncbi:MAG: zinc metallopeptidase [Candidatus Bipolaricaulis sp.]|nr:zinc metallopeptidase [Candidatus Bipolaricaulis sp.]MDD5219086.1 zinc metallopeptidase [Candidatus Bipolaricaulis sp.]MDD5645640.1 zinc metallopeptidase [Candidatus Bipolaricaulis sp.]